MNRPVRIFLVEDHGLVRAGIRALLEKIEGVEIAGDAAEGREALERIDRHRPDIVLMDISMPGLNGLQAAEQMLQRHPQLRIVFLSMHTEGEYVLAALRAGASGYLIKDSCLQELELAIRSVVRGEVFISPAVSKHVVDGIRNPNALPASPLERLTLRQKEILQLIAEGMTTKEIAVRLNVSVKTVDTHRTQLMERLDIHDVAGLVRFAIANGLAGL